MTTLVKNDRAFDAALGLAMGSYQRNLLLGFENLSGSSLRGKARRYGGKYALSRHNLLSRMKMARIPFSEIRGKHNARILVIG